MYNNILKIWDLIEYDSQTHGNNTAVVVTGIDSVSRSILGILRNKEWAQEERIIPMSNGSIRVKKVSDPNQSSQITTTENEFLKELNSRNYAPLLADLLKDTANHNEYLLPTRIKQFKNRAFGFPEKIEQTDKVRLPMWIKLDSGQIDVVYVYLSDSDGRFHVSPGFDGLFNRLIKWDNFGLSYVTANRLDPEIERYIHSIYGKTMVGSGLPRRVRWFTWNLLAKNDSLNGLAQYQYTDFARSVIQWTGSEVFYILWFHDSKMKPSEWYKDTQLTPQDILNALHNNGKLFHSLLSFSREESSYHHFHANKGSYQVHVYVSYLAWRNIEWHIWEEWETIWLDNVFIRMNNPLNAYGVHWIPVNVGWLISKPWEYKSQVWECIMKHPLAHMLVKEVNDPAYISVEPFLDKSPITELYKQHRSWIR